MRLTCDLNEAVLYEIFYSLVRKMTLHPVTLHSLILYISYHLRGARGIHVAYKNYLSSAMVAFIGTIFNREDTLFPLSSRHNTYLTAMTIFSMGYAGGGGGSK